MKTHIPSSQQEGMLKRCYLDMGVEFSDSCYEYLKNGEIPYTLTEVAGMLEISKIKPGQSFSYVTDYTLCHNRCEPSIEALNFVVGGGGGGGSGQM